MLAVPAIVLLVLAVALMAILLVVGINVTILPDVPRRVECIGLLRRYFACPIFMVLLTALAVFAALGPGPPEQVPAGSSKASFTTVTFNNGAAIVSVPCSTST